MKYHYGFPQHVWDIISAALRPEYNSNPLCRTMRDHTFSYYYDVTHNNEHAPFHVHYLSTVKEPEWLYLVESEF
jgi:hypothetical protein